MKGRGQTTRREEEEHHNFFKEHKSCKNQERHHNIRSRATTEQGNIDIINNNTNIVMKLKYK